jgi:hypothetical protein
MLGLPWFTMVYHWPSNFWIATDTAACFIWHSPFFINALLDGEWCETCEFEHHFQVVFTWVMWRNGRFTNAFDIANHVGMPLIWESRYDAVIQDDEPHVLNTAHVLLVLYMTLIFRGRVPAKMEQCPTKLLTNLGRRFGSAGYPIQSNLVCVQKSKILSSNLSRKWSMYLWSTLVGALEHFLWLSIQLGMSSSQLTKSIIFQRGRLKPGSTTNLSYWSQCNNQRLSQTPQVDCHVSKIAGELYTRRRIPSIDAKIAKRFPEQLLQLIPSGNWTLNIAIEDCHILRWFT